jgi:hypothetical protein
MKPQALVGIDTLLLATAALAATFVAAAPLQAGRIVTTLLFL